MSKKVTFVSFSGDLSPRLFLNQEAWPAGETRLLEDEAAAELDAHFPGCFEIGAPEAPKITNPKAPASPAEEQR